jgi:protein-tyrosine phosphatase
MNPNNKVLFLCMGNYFRSRFAEELFNALAAQAGIPHRALSRGLRFSGNNRGPISPFAVTCLRDLGVDVNDPRYPLYAEDNDFSAASLIVSTYESEQRPIIDVRFPRHAPRVEYWDVRDVPGNADPTQREQLAREALRAIEKNVRALVHRLAHDDEDSSAA